jgi:hypothetical protein
MPFDRQPVKRRDFIQGFLYVTFAKAMLTGVIHGSDILSRQRFAYCQQSYRVRRAMILVLCALNSVAHQGQTSGNRVCVMIQEAWLR